MGERMNFQQLNTIMDTATDQGTMRRVTYERFEELCRHPVAWNELDMLPCHAELLNLQADERDYQARRNGAVLEDGKEFKRDTKKPGKPVAKAAPDTGEEGSSCNLM